MILHFKTTIIYCFIIGILILSFKRTSAQVYHYNSIENTDFEVNPAYFGIKNNKPEFLGMYLSLAIIFIKFKLFVQDLQAILKT